MPAMLRRAHNIAAMRPPAGPNARSKLLPLIQRRLLSDGDLIPLSGRFSLSGKSYLVTGGGRGIGYGAVRGIAEMGGNVAVVDRASAPVDDFARLQGEFGVKTKYFSADVTDEKAMSQAFEDTISDFGTLDGLVTAAGIVPEGPFISHTTEEVRKCFDVNIFGTYLAAQLATRQMLKQGKGGSIVFISSVSAHQATPGHRLSAYNASKGAVTMLRTALGVELGPENIRVNAIAPGCVDTDMLKPLKELDPSRVELMNTSNPMGRIASRNDIVPAIIYLLSDASLYTTSAEIFISGGLHAGRITSP